MDRQTRICVWIIVVGLLNFIAYGVAYGFLGGEAVYGRVIVRDRHVHYYLQSPATPQAPAAARTDARALPDATEIEVSRGVYIYSGIHSITILMTVAAIMLAMLTLAKERIVSSMRSTIVRGRTFITILATVVSLVVAVITIWFILQFTRKLANPQQAILDTRQTRIVSCLSLEAAKTGPAHHALMLALSDESAL